MLFSSSICVRLGEDFLNQEMSGREGNKVGVYDAEGASQGRAGRLQGGMGQGGVKPKGVGQAGERVGQGRSRILRRKGTGEGNM